MKKIKIDMKKKDWILIIIIVCIAAGAFLLHYVLRDTARGTVTVKVNGVIEGTYELKDDQEISINHGTNTLKINNGEAKMEEADCPDQLCVHQRAISGDNESIICLPNRVIVEVQSKKDSKFDAVTN